MMKKIATDLAPAAIGPYVQAIVVGKHCYVSGQLGIEMPEGELAQTDTVQLRQALENIETILQSAGFAKEDIVKVTLYITDMARFLALNAVYTEFFGNHHPARSCVAVAALPKGAAVEVDVIACQEV